MSNMISVASGFQYSVNIGYDLNSDDKLKNFIPTKSALMLLEDVLLSTNSNSTDRARVLVGAYGKGKSHIVLTILAMLMKKDVTLFERLMPKIESSDALTHLVESYYNSENKLFPVVITGSNTSLSQAFLIALQRALSENNMLDIMPETNFMAAIQYINKWKEDYPKVYKQLEALVDEPMSSFVSRLEAFDLTAYSLFEKIYPELTAGSVFNPFLGFDVVELYEAAVKGLQEKGFSGIYVVYDEFSKFLETNISEASVSDTKMLQDFAEKCNRSGKNQLHLMLISHKEISNYIDKLPKQKVDGWRGVSERFRHIHLNNNYTQTYEIITSAITKNPAMWGSFCKEFNASFEAVEQLYTKHQIFSDVDENDIRTMLFGCYPLHPVSTFILPRLSERVAQNERTLFTFISASGHATLPSFLDCYEDDCYKLITPDLIYDYFEPLFKKEVYEGELHKTYFLTSVILEKLDKNSLESKIIKALSLIYMLEQFERLQPTRKELVGIFSNSYTVKEIDDAISNLIDKEFVIYLRRSNEYLKLKQTSGIDVHQKIADLVVKDKQNVAIKDVLNEVLLEKYLFPARYNNDHEMIRYFSFQFIDEKEVSENTNWDLKSKDVHSDGVIYGIVLHSENGLTRIKRLVETSSAQYSRFVFVVPKHFKVIEEVAREYHAVETLRNSSIEDKVLFEEYEVIYEDLREVLNDFISGYIRPEKYSSVYIIDGKEVGINRKAALSELLSTICDSVYCNTPVINNEAMNRDEITSTAQNSQNKIVSGLLRNELEHNLGLGGSSQAVSIMRSTLIRTGIWIENDDIPSLNLAPKDLKLCNLLKVIEDFIICAGKNDKTSFEMLYQRLISPEYHIGIRKGLIPIYLAVVLHAHKKEVVISGHHGQVPLTADTLMQINSKPENFYVSYLNWDSNKEEYIDKLTLLFSHQIIDEEKLNNSYDYVASAMKRWYMSLPRFSKECKIDVNGIPMKKQELSFTRALKSTVGAYELLFEKIPTVLKKDPSIELVESIREIKRKYDNLLANLENTLIRETKSIFSLECNQHVIEKASLLSIVQDWCESLNDAVFDELFADGTEKCLLMFKECGNDEVDSVARLARLATDLRIQDWDDSTIDKYRDMLNRWKASAESFVEKDLSNIAQHDLLDNNSYEVTFVEGNGSSITKRFERIDFSKRAQLLKNQIFADVEAMGQSISEQEKRQVLMEILKDLC